MTHLNRCKTSAQFVLLFLVSVTSIMNSAGGTGVTLVPVPTKTARCHSDIKGRRPFDVPAYFSSYGKRPSQEPQWDSFGLHASLPQSGF